MIVIWQQDRYYTPDNEFCLPHPCVSTTDFLVWDLYEQHWMNGSDTMPVLSTKDNSNEKNDFTWGGWLPIERGWGY